MTDLLYVSFDKDEIKKETGLCVGRTNKYGSHKILKMELDDQADILYKILTNQSVKAIQLEVVEQIRAEILDQYPDHQCTGELTGYAEAIEDILEIIDKALKEHNE